MKPLQYSLSIYETSSDSTRLTICDFVEAMTIMGALPEGSYVVGLNPIENFIPVKELIDEYIPKSKAPGPHEVIESVENKKKRSFCVWNRVFKSGVYEVVTSCGHKIDLEKINSNDNYCPFCKKEIIRQISDPDRQP